MFDLLFPPRHTWLILCLSFSFLLNAQADQYELEIGDRLYAFEMARVQHDFGKMLDMTYPLLFTLIPRETLEEQLSLATAGQEVSNSRLKAFQVTITREPQEVGNNIYLAINLSYYRSLANGSRQQIKRSLLAIRKGTDLNWYFLETKNGQKDLLSSIIPVSLL